MRASSWQHVALSVAVTVVVAGLFLFLFVWPALSSRAAFGERLQTLQFQQREFTDTAARTRPLQREMEAIAGLDARQEGFLEEKPGALAAADLQQLAQALVEQTGGSLLSAQALQDAGAESIFPEVTVKVHLRASMEALQRLLYRISTNQPLLLTDNLLVQKRRQGDRAGQSGDADQLEVRFDVTAFIYRERLP